VSDFYGRTAELSTLKPWIVQDSRRLVTLSGMGGIGKTALAVKTTEQVQDKFEWLILRNAPPIKDLLRELILFFLTSKLIPETVDSLISWCLIYIPHAVCWFWIMANQSCAVENGLDVVWLEG